MADVLPFMKRHLQLDYLAEYPISASTGPRRRNVRLELDRFQIPKDLFSSGNRLAWQFARELEGNPVADESIGIGVWPINFFRCEHRFGQPPFEFFGHDASIADASPETFAAAHKYRGLLYHRVANIDEAKELLLTTAQSMNQRGR